MACWNGGVWSDAEGADDETGAANARRRCDNLVVMLYGSSDATRYERIRALEPVEISELKQKILAVARSESLPAVYVEQLGAFIEDVADVERETMLARRAGDRVKRDIEGSRKHGKLRSDELEGVEPLRNARALDKLFQSELGDLTHEAHAVALLCAIDRMQTAYGLTKHLKVYTVEEPLAAIFGVGLPAVPDDPQQSLRGGAWLAYLSGAATAAGHPVPKSAQTLEERERLARGGVLEGLADKLRGELEQIPAPNELRRVAAAVVTRIDTKYREAEASVMPERAAHRPAD